MKSRIKPDNFYGGIRSNEWLEANKNFNVNGQLVSEWTLTEVLPNENLKKPFWNGSAWVEGYTDEDLRAELIEDSNLKKQEILERLKEELIIDKAQQLDDEQAFVNQEIYPMWDGNGVEYKKDIKCRHFNAQNELKLYRCIQPITSQPQFPPRTIEAHFVEVFEPSAGSEYEVWSQRTGANASEYSIGKIVWYQNEGDQLWISKINNNVTVPDGDVPFNRYWEPYTP